MKNLIPIFYGIVRNGKLALEKKEEFRNVLAKLEGKEISLFLKPSHFVRSIPQNSYYWAVIVRMVSEEMGVLPGEAHDYLKGLFLKVGVENKGRRWEILRSTTTLSVGEFEDYCEKARQWAANELSTVIPLPNEIEIDLGESHNTF